MGWFLIRVIPNPARAAYPCQQAAFPALSAFVLWLIGVKASLIGWFVARRRTVMARLSRRDQSTVQQSPAPTQLLNK